MIEKISQVLESALNTYVKLDPECLRELRMMEGKCVKVQVTDLQIIVFLCFKEESIQVLPAFAGKVAAIIKGKSFYLLFSPFLPNAAQYFDIQGDVEIGYQVYSLFKSIEIDWEEQLSHYTGDIIAHQMGNLARWVTGSLKSAGRNLQENTTEYIQEEICLLPSSQEVEDFCQDVEQLRQRVERLEAYLG